MNDWRIVKACNCKGASGAGWPVPYCKLCGRPWRFEWITKSSASEDTNTPTKPTADDVAPEQKQ